MKPNTPEPPSVKTSHKILSVILTVTMLVTISAIATYTATSIKGQQNTCAVSNTPTPLRDIGRC